MKYLNVTLTPFPGRWPDRRARGRPLHQHWQRAIGRNPELPKAQEKSAVATPQGSSPLVSRSWHDSDPLASPPPPGGPAGSVIADDRAAGIRGDAEEDQPDGSPGLTTRNPCCHHDDTGTTLLLGNNCQGYAVPPGAEARGSGSVWLRLRGDAALWGLSQGEVLCFLVNLSHLSTVH